MTEIPTSDRIVARPVWLRRQARHHTAEPLGPPTEAEMHDAILVLADPDLAHEHRDLWLEASRIFTEASA